MDARAFAFGNDVFLGRGESPHDARLMSHELTHVAQHRLAGVDTSAAIAQRKVSVGQSNEPAERQADQVSSLIASGLAPLPGFVLTPSSRVHRTDLHAGLSGPSATQITAIDTALNPTAPAGAMWDGASSGGTVSATAQTARNALRTALVAAIRAHLDAKLPDMTARSTRPRLPITSLQGAADAAKAYTDARMGTWATGVALTPEQAGAHGHAFQSSGAGQNLFDANDVGQRASAGIPINANRRLSWIAETDTTCRQVATAHGFNLHSAGEQEGFFRLQIRDPFIANATNRADLETYDQWGFASTNPTTGNVTMGTFLPPGLSTTPGTGGAPSPAEQSRRWSAWKVLVHEYLHTLTHPRFREASQGRRVMTEGFCELMRKEMFTADLANVPTMTAIVHQVEGGNFGQPPNNVVGTTYDAGSYASYVQSAETIAANSPGGMNALKAAYFQGHVEFIGLSPAGAMRPGAAPGSADLITVPPGATTVALLATAANVAASVITGANPGLTASTTPLPATLHVPGARDHLVVNTGPDSTGAQASEGAAEIAAQNGVTTTALTTANPGRNLASLHGGDRVLIPVHP
jgi:hypothetical protein